MEATSVKNEVRQLYKDVMCNVLSSVRSQCRIRVKVIKELKQRWEAKLEATGACGRSREEETTNKIENTRVPLKVVLLPSVHKAVDIMVPQFILKENRIHEILTGHLIDAVADLPTTEARDFLQHYVDAGLERLERNKNVVADVSNKRPQTMTEQSETTDMENVELQPQSQVREKGTTSGKNQFMNTKNLHEIEQRNNQLESQTGSGDLNKQMVELKNLRGTEFYDASCKKRKRKKRKIDIN